MAFRAYFASLLQQSDDATAVAIMDAAVDGVLHGTCAFPCATFAGLTLTYEWHLTGFVCSAVLLTSFTRA